MYKKGISCSTTASESIFWKVSCTPAPTKFITINAIDDNAIVTGGVRLHRFAAIRAYTAREFIRFAARLLVVEDDLGAGFGEEAYAGGTDAARSAGDDGDFP